MIVLDTNVLSETLQPSPDATVMTWLAAQPGATLFTTSVNKAEILYGLYRLPEGSRKDALSNAIGAIFSEDFADRLLSFDSTAAEAYAEISVSRKNRGRLISQPDAMIAAITRSRGAMLATRNGKDFTDCGIAIIDPWVD